MTSASIADRRRASIKRIAAQRKGQPLRAHVLKRHIFIETGIKTTDATVKRDMRILIDAKPSMYYLHRCGALVRYE
ncbi:hypothetical protein [Vreelandella alkaliphila]|uniref:Uncharacterized protein n=1 Tax=Vreelandella alkaliphila TaxID=272774 RepID=A0AAJ2RXL0_9GAMM|nr:hypothetical protein [Halomonas alkaliphila]MDX5979611.1 hypothetical protein [Halomonas alkaliphila]